MPLLFETIREVNKNIFATHLSDRSRQLSNGSRQKFSGKQPVVVLEFELTQEVQRQRLSAGQQRN